MEILLTAYDSGTAKDVVFQALKRCEGKEIAWDKIPSGHRYAMGKMMEWDKGPMKLPLTELNRLEKAIRKYWQELERQGESQLAEGMKAAFDSVKNTFYYAKERAGAT